MPDQAGKLTPEEKQSIIAKLNGYGPTNACPICRSVQWAVADHIVQPVTLNAQGGMVIGGLGYPTIMLISDPCGYTMYVNAVILGVMPGQPSSEKK